MADAQQNFILFEACQKEMFVHVRKPNKNEPKDSLWKPFYENSMTYKYLKSISINAIALNAEIYSEKEKLEQWIGRQGATEEQIFEAEKRLGIELPKDVKEFYQITNGTAEILSHTFCGFDAIENIDWLKNAIPDMLIWYVEMGEDYVADLTNSIIIAGIDHVHNILIIQPYGKHKKWRYWEFASYIPGENEFKGIKKYLERINDFLEDQIKNKEETIPTIDYSHLKTALLAKDWQQVYSIFTGIVLNNLQYPSYIPNDNLYALGLLASHYLGNQQHLITVLNSLPQFITNERQLNNYLIDKYKVCAEKKELFFEDLQELKRFKPHENSQMLEIIEAQIMIHRKDLLRPENLIAKQDYQLYFLYEYGNTEEYISLFESDAHIANFCDLLKTAKVYLANKENEKAMKCIEKYLADNIDEVGLEAFVDEQLHILLK